MRKNKEINQSIEHLSAENQRLFDRINLTGQLRLSFNNEDYFHPNCQVKNISLTGVSLKGEFPELQKGSATCTLKFDSHSKKNCMPIQTPCEIETSCEIVWSDEHIVGLRFKSMTFDSYMSFSWLLVSETNHPAKLINDIPLELPFEVIL